MRNQKTNPLNHLNLINHSKPSKPDKPHKPSKQTILLNSYGIYDKSYQLLLEAIRSFPEIEQALIFGSRALGNAKKGSDIDLSVSGKAVTSRTIDRLSLMLNSDLPIPYHVDVVQLEKISNPQLLEHIQTHGKVIFERDKS